MVGSNVGELELKEDAAARASGRFINDETLLAEWPKPGRIYLVVQPRKIEDVKKVYATARLKWERARSAARDGGKPFDEPPPETPVFAAPAFRYHLIAQTPDYYLISNQP